MTSRIYKYVLQPGKTQLSMPFQANPLCVAFQGDELCLWAEVCPDNRPDTRLFEVFATGENIVFDMGVERKYIGTAHTVDMGMRLVFHVYERIN